MGSEFASYNQAYHQKEQSFVDFTAQRQQHYEQALRKLKEDLKKSAQLQFLTPVQQSNPIRITIDADGDFKSDLILEFVKSGKNVQITAKSQLKEGVQTSFTIQPQQPELFYIWHYITSNGREPYQLFFSLLPQHRAILNLYDELPDDLYKKLAKEIKNSPKRRVPPEIVTGSEENPKIKSNIDQDKLQLAKYQHPGKLAFIEAADKMTIDTSKNYGTNTITYTFKHNNKQVGELVVNNYNFPKQEPLITAQQQSEKQQQEDKKYGTFRIPIKVGRPTERHYNLMVIPGRDKAPASIGVSHQSGKKQLTWGNTIKVDLPKSESGELAYHTEPRDNHLAVFFYTPPAKTGQNKGQNAVIPKIPQLMVYYQDQMHFNEKKQVTFENEPFTYEIRGLHLYTANENHQSFIAYYRNGKLQTGKANADIHTQQIEAVRDARKHKAPPQKPTTTPTEIKDVLFWQENAFIKQAWQHPAMKKQQLIVNNYTNDPYDNIQDSLPQAKRHYIKVNQLYPGYVKAMLALYSLAPIVTKAKANGGVFARTPKMNAMLTVLAEDIAAYEQASEIGFLKTEGRYGKVPLVSTLVKAGELNQLNVKYLINEFESSMLKLTKYFYVKVVQEDTKTPLKKRLAQIDQIKKTGNRRQNFQDYLSEKNIEDNTKMIPIEARFYPHIPSFQKNQTRVTQEWLKKDRIPVLKIPIFAHIDKNNVWHIISLAHHDQGKHYNKSLPELKGEDLKKYQKTPPPALFDLLDSNDHLPPGWLIYSLPNDTKHGQQHVPLQIKKHWPPEEIALWLGVALLVFGAAAYTGGLSLLATDAFFAATMVGGTGALLATTRREASDTMTKQERWFNYADMASAVIGLGTFSRIIKAGGKIIKGNTALQTAGKYIYLGSQIGDFGVDTSVVIGMNLVAGKQLSEIMDMSAPLEEKLSLMTKTFALLAAQNLLLIGTVKGRLEDIGKAFKQLRPQKGGGGNVEVDPDQPPGPQITKADTPELYELTQQKTPKWSAELLEEVAGEIGAQKLNQIAKSLDEMEDVTRQSLQKMYPEKDLLHALYASKGHVGQARSSLSKYYGVKQEGNIYRQVEEEGLAKNSLERASEHLNITQQPSKQAQKTADSYYEKVVKSSKKRFEAANQQKTDLDGEIKQLQKEVNHYEAQRVAAGNKITELNSEIEVHRAKGNINAMPVNELRYKVDTEWKMQRENLQGDLKRTQERKTKEETYVSNYEDKYLKQKKARQAKVEADKQRHLKRQVKRIKAKPGSPKWKKAKNNIEIDADKRFQNKLNNTEIEVKLPDGTEFKRSIQAHDIHLSKKKELIENYKDKIDKTNAQIEELNKKLTQGKKMLELNDGNPQRQGLGYWHKEKYSLDQQQEDFTQKTKKIGRLQKVRQEAKASELRAKNTYTKARLEYVGLQSKAKKLQEAETYKKAQKRYEAAQKRYAAARKQSRQAQETMRRRHHLLGWYRHQATTQQRILKHLKKAAKTLFVPGPKTGDLDVDKALWALCRTFLSLQSLPNADPVYQPAIAQEMKRELAVYLKGFFTQLANLHYTPKEKVVKSHMEGYRYTQAELQKVATDKLKTELRSALQNMQQELRVLITHQALIDQGENKK